ncbi:sugar transporter, partial [Rhizobium ruizarguesonis]
MNQHDRNRVSRLPGWRSFEPSQTAPEGVRMRSPVVRPDYFVRPSPEPAPPPVVPPASIAESRQNERPAPPPKQPVVDAPLNAASAPAAPLL